jgi:hypothetical protein
MSEEDGVPISQRRPHLSHVGSDGSASRKRANPQSIGSERRRYRYLCPIRIVIVRPNITSEKASYRQLS